MRINKIFCLAAGGLLATVWSANFTQAADVRSFWIGKEQSYSQSNPDAPTLNLGEPYGFRAYVWATATNSVASATLRLPSGSNKALTWDLGDVALLYWTNFAAKASLDATCGPGTYLLTINAANDGTKTINLNLSADSYPNPPHVRNYAAAQAIDPSMDFVLSWDPFVGGASNDIITVSVFDRRWNKVFETPIQTPGALNGTNTSVIIPRGRLAAGAVYFGILNFIKITQSETAAYPGAGGGAGYGSTTSFSMYAKTPTAPPDVGLMVVAKGQSFAQTSSGAPVLLLNNPFGFVAFAEMTGTSTVNSASLRLPNGTVKTLAAEEGEYRYEMNFATKAALDTEYSSGNYTLTLNTVHNGTKIVSLPLGLDAYPSTPQVVNFDAAQAVNTQTPFTLTRTAFAGGTANDFVQVEISAQDDHPVFDTSGPGESGALNGTATSIVLPAGTFAPGQTYSASLLFVKITTLNTNDYPGAQGVAAYYKNTEFELKTLAAGTGPDVSMFGAVKGQNYIQTNSGAPAPDAARPFAFQAFVDTTGAGVVNSATLRMPNALTRSLGIEEDGLYVDDYFTNQVVFDGAYPNGTYALTINAVHDGTRTVTFNLAGDTYPPVPRISNFAATQAIDPAQGFHLTWDPIPGATGSNFIQVEIDDARGDNVFGTPGPTEPGALNDTATAVTIPRSTLAPGQTYYARLLFAKISHRDTNSYPGALGVAGYYRNTMFQLQTLQPPAPVFVNFGMRDGRLQTQLITVAGLTYTIEISTNLMAWTPLLTTNVTTSVITLVYPEPITGFPKLFFRAKVGDDQTALLRLWYR